MKHHKPLLILSFLAWTLTGPHASYAAVNLRYDDRVPQRIEALLKTHYAENTYEAASIDLNNDGIKEYIVRSADCTDVCSYNIFADKHDRLLILGAIEKARHLTVSDETTSGVRDIIVYRDKSNDYRETQYRWDATRSRYTISDERPDP